MPTPSKANFNNKASSLEQPGKLVSEHQTIPYFDAARDNGGDDYANWNSKTCKALVKSLPQARHHSVFLQPRRHSYHPNNSVEALKVKSLGIDCE